MSRPTKRTTDLSAKKRALLQALMHKEGIAAQSEPKIPCRNTADPVPLSFAQQRLWFLDRFDAGTTAYTILSAVQLTGLLNVTALHGSLKTIVQRHEALRTTFAEDRQTGQPVQVITPSLSLALPLVDLQELPADTRLAEARRLALLEARQPFDLQHGPLIRARLVRLDDTEHLLVLTIHHSVADGWSMGVLFDELAACYAAATSGEDATLPDLPIQYADYAHWQRQQLQGAALEAQLDYWRAQLADAPPVLELPTDRPRPARQTSNGARYDLLLPQRLADALTALSQQEGTTLFMTLLAAFDVLLQRYSGQHDIVVGSPIAGRTQHETKNLIGCFVNTLVLRTRLDGNPTFRELLSRVREVCLGAYAHQDLPFEQLVEALQPQREPSYTPLFQVLFVLQNIPAEVAEMAGVQIQRFIVATQTTTFDLTLTLEETTDGLKSTLIYNTDLFDSATIERMAQHWETLLTGIAATPDLQIADLPLLTMAERQQIVLDWNATGQEYAHDRCLHHLFEAQAARTPDAVAVVFGDQRLTYGELDRRANQLAHYLRKLGVEPEVSVALLAERSLDLLVGLLGILKAGGVYVPLDSAYPNERIQLILQDTQAPVLLTQQRLCPEDTPKLPESIVSVICLDADWSQIAQQPCHPVSTDVTTDHLAYIIYTSGSTGKPKGVGCHHRGVVNLLADFQRRQPIASGTACSWWTSLSFDVSIYELFSALVAGGALHIVPDTARVEADVLRHWLHQQQIGSAYLPPFLLANLAADWERMPTPPLQRLLVGVEPIPEPLLARITAAIPGLQIINGYGPTEATVCATLLDFDPRTAGAGITPIGRPVQNMQVYVLDTRMQPVPIGVAGEIYIGGTGLARGYLNRPDLTAERFVPSPFAGYQQGEPGSRLYKTGDLARYRPDGTLEFVGRTDYQVKVRGFRIELGEIENTLLRHPDVQDAIVIARTDSSATGSNVDLRLIAYVVGEPGSHSEGLDVSELRGFLKESLPDYMVPSAFVLLDRLPQTPSGKVDRGALPAPQWSAAVDSFAAPRNELEQVLAEIWAELLPVERIGIHDNFFDLGGHSLLATRLVSRLRETFQVEVSLRSLFEAPTIAQLNDLIETLLIEQLQALSEDEVKRLAADSGR
jgi:amino acid adenylation domain-containing protein